MVRHALLIRMCPIIPVKVKSLNVIYGTESEQRLRV